MTYPAGLLRLLAAVALSPLAAVQPAQAQAVWAPSADDLANPSKVGLIFEGEWTTNAGRLRIERVGAGDNDVFKGTLWPDGGGAPYLFEGLRPNVGGGLIGTWRRSGSTERRGVNFVIDRSDGDRFGAGIDGWPLGSELEGRRGYEGASGPEPEPAPPQPVPSRPVPSQPVPPVPAPPQTPANDGFKPVGKFDARIDKVVAEGRYWHVYVTLRNATAYPLVQAEGVDVRLEDSEGLGVESGQAVRARPGPPELFGSPPPTTRPGGTIAVKFVFDKREGASPARILVMEGEREAAFRLG
ncbi:hypothetical protein [Sphingomonas sp. G-3-2-10]|uniref:hypothetical protein n=1 Tax=Sphingomonas sp. G-3-2-10 TaxID=2728838 RepID=UPI00146F839F|nr:hypothetical protein [Sphingomonas sp. G-3-2-10]NML08290.1 hypothetical protein [Sphingomonas sp. G-3-2-10]